MASEGALPGGVATVAGTGVHTSVFAGSRVGSVLACANAGAAASTPAAINSGAIFKA
ncbi:hypothetical protein D3C72_2502970 [compost metagenome]